MSAEAIDLLDVMNGAELPPRSRAFDGETYDFNLDFDRLGRQLRQVAIIMSDGRWHTLAELHMCIPRSTEASISARLRDLRKPKYGSQNIEHERMTDTGLWRYRWVR